MSSASSSVADPALARARRRFDQNLEVARLARQPQHGVMLDLLHIRGVVAIVGRRDGQRLWDLAERWYPETETVALRDAERLLAERRFRSLGVRLTANGWEAHPEATDGPVPDRVTFLSPSTA